MTDARRLTISFDESDVEFLFTAIDRISDSSKAIAKAIDGALVSPNELDTNFEAANVVDGLFAIARAVHHVAKAIEGVKTEEEHDAHHDGRPLRIDAGRLTPLWANVVETPQ